MSRTLLIALGKWGGLFARNVRQRFPRLALFVKHLVDARQSIHDRLTERVGTLSKRQARLFLLAVAGTALLAHPVAAQMGDVGSALCQNGLGQLLAIILAGASFYFFVKGGFRGMAGLDKKGSKKSGTQQEGDEQLMGAGYSFAASAAPVVLAAIGEVVGISTVSCFNFNVGVFAGMISPLGPLGPVVAVLGPVGTQGVSLAALGVLGYVRA